MKTLSTYLNERYIIEKLKLSDIKKNSLNGEWIDSSDIKFNEIEEGNIIEVSNGFRYLVVSGKITKNIFPNAIFSEKDLAIIREYKRNTYGYIYALLDEYSETYPFYCLSNCQKSILRVYTSKKHYKNKEEVFKDIKKINTL